jgi:hypothetical protein
MTSRPSPLVLVVLAAVLASMFAAPAQGADDKSAAEAATGSAQPPAGSASDRAEAALANVQEILGGEPRGARPHGQSGAPAEASDAAPGDATMALRDLVLLKDELTGADRKQANELLARPATDQKVCNPRVCVHYATGTATPAYAATVLATVAHVHNTYVAAGYRAPKSDGTRGGDGRTDIYLEDIGNRGLYGYCTTDRKPPRNGPYDMWAYCVLDNDYSRAEFPTNTPIENLQVTAAHEYFHAVQFGYDIAEDVWFMEATAAWVEDEVYDAVDDNVQYLASGPLRVPRLPMDSFGGSFHYGTWIFFRYLSERWPAKQGALPTIVRDMWRKADGSAGKPDKYSMQAVKAVLKSKKQSFPKLFAKFSNANRRPKQVYDEGKANKYRSAPLVKRYRLRRGQQRTRTIEADHLTSATVRFTPAKALKSRRAKLRIALKMAPARQGSAAVASVKLKSGKVRTISIRIRKSGRATKAVPFSARKVKNVELTLANAGTKYRCFNGGSYSCQGTSKNDNVSEFFRAAVVVPRS